MEMVQEMIYGIIYERILVKFDEAMESDSLLIAATPELGPGVYLANNIVKRHVAINKGNYKLGIDESIRHLKITYNSMNAETKSFDIGITLAMNIIQTCMIEQVLLSGMTVEEKHHEIIMINNKF